MGEIENGVGGLNSSVEGVEVLEDAGARFKRDGDERLFGRNLLERGALMGDTMLNEVLDEYIDYYTEDGILRCGRGVPITCAWLSHFSVLEGCCRVGLMYVGYQRVDGILR